MAAGDLSGLSRLVGVDKWFVWRKPEPRRRYRFSWGPEAAVVWAQTDGGQEIVARVDMVVESYARSLADVVHWGSHDWDALTRYLILVRAGEDWQISGNVSQSDGVHYETDELLGSAAQADRIHDQATIQLATEDEDEDRSPATVELTDIGADTRARLLDLSNVDARFAPEVIAASAREIVRAWEQATVRKQADERTRDALRSLTTHDAFTQLTHPTPHGLRRVSQLEIRKIEIRDLSQGREPPTVVVRITLHGVRWLDATSGSFISGDPFYARRFRELWTLELGSDKDKPWRVSNVEHPGKG